MIIRKVKHILISNRIGRFLDVALRSVFSFIPRLFKLIRLKKQTSFDGFIFFSYGGIGDIVLTVPLVNKLSSYKKTIVLCDKRVVDLSFLYDSSVEFVLYDKKNLIKSLLNIRQKNDYRDFLFIQTSPIIEQFIVARILRINLILGNILSHSSISSIGLKIKLPKVISHNKCENFNNIFLTIKPSNSQDPESSFKKPQTSIDKNFSSSYRNRFVLISPTKSQTWTMGKMEEEEYAKLADYISLKYGLDIIFTGNKLESNYIESIIDKTRNKNHIINLAGKFSLDEISILMEKASFVIANDNGIAHLSAFMNVKVLVLFMFSDPNVYMWNQENYQFIFNKISDCMPCVGINKYPKDNYPVLCKNNLICNKSITSEEILEKLKGLKWL